jgi:hypothetical protein
MSTYSRVRAERLQPGFKVCLSAPGPSFNVIDAYPVMGGHTAVVLAIPEGGRFVPMALHAPSTFMFDCLEFACLLCGQHIREGERCNCT